MFITAITAIALAVQPAGPPNLEGTTVEVEGEPGVERTTFGPNMTFTDYFEGEVAKSGTYFFKPNGEMCFTFEGSEEPACWINQGVPDAEGWMTSVRVSDGLKIRVRPVANGALEASSIIGTFTVYTEDGTLAGTSTNSDDGSWLWTNTDGSTFTGRWEITDGKLCNDIDEPEGVPDQGPMCWAKDGADAQGRTKWVSEGDVPTVAFTTFEPE